VSDDLGKALPASQSKFRKIAFAVGIATLFCTPLSQAALRPAVAAAAMAADKQARIEFAKDNVGGMTIGVISEGRLAWTKSYGLADMKTKRPASRETIYRIGSVTKQFTALMLQQLVESGKVHLSDPVRLYLPEVDHLRDAPSRASPISLVQLATHTSGLDREPDSDQFVRGSVTDWEKTLIAAIPHTHYIREPGSEFWYSNIGYAILGAALSHAAHEPFTKYVSDHILRPLGMHDTFFEIPADRRNRIATGYVIDGATADAEEPMRQRDGRGFKIPPGGLFSTVDDLAKFVSFEMGDGPESVLSRKAMEENRGRLLLLGQVDYAYGLGIQWHKLGDAIAWGHSGNVDGYQAEVFFIRKSRIGVVVLASSTGGKLDPFAIVRAALTDR
jgi:CubicO group peptidase (beta-lactamase class C family)